MLCVFFFIQQLNWLAFAKVAIAIQKSIICNHAHARAHHNFHPPNLVIRQHAETRLPSLESKSVFDYANQSTKMIILRLLQTDAHFNLLFMIYLHKSRSLFVYYPNRVMLSVNMDSNDNDDDHDEEDRNDNKQNPTSF